VQDTASQREALDGGSGRLFACNEEDRCLVAEQVRGTGGEPEAMQSGSHPGKNDIVRFKDVDNRVRSMTVVSRLYNPVRAHRKRFSDPGEQTSGGGEVLST
jgi:hypothetical protein